MTDGIKTRGLESMDSTTTKTDPIRIGVAYDTGTEIVILGRPDDEDFLDAIGASDGDPRRHNCDAMGCGGCHVLYRIPKNR